ncbi:uncharacterized protein cd5 [Sphaeramia orbicularis]|uniref:uncharacterized protein cd5 n=1 Tax=Sphaeramia orbicularis TaxID=375764 RepID=UPI00117DC6ED|nr:uncharacterized protein LOC115418931 [Sphaeramia orbicularis]
MMDLWIVATFSALLLMTCEPVQTSDKANETRPTSITPKQVNTSTISSCNCDQTPMPIITPTHTLAFLIIKWQVNCTANVTISEHLKSKPVCYSSWTQVQSLLTNVCKNKKGCKGDPTSHKGGDIQGYHISERGIENTTCKMLKVRCTEEHHPDQQAELHGYKVVTALFCCALVVLLLIRFTRPTVKALQKRLSDKRQNRWIGPTQSHSVSYHRGQNTLHKNSDGEHRLSYPALERLAVSNSREPSSNRSSYNF